MPITRRKRVNPPEQPENTHGNEQAENAQAAVTEHAAVEQPAEEQGSVLAEPASPLPSTSPVSNVNEVVEAGPAAYQPFAPQPSSSAPAMNGERKEAVERPERIARAERTERHEYTPTIEGGRRTSRGELFRRPPQPPAPQPVAPAPVQPPLQAPTHEISLPLGNLLHLAYNPGYTGADEARSQLLDKLTKESKAGGRARCWNCGSIAIVYDRWNTRSKPFGEVGVAFCEICGVWSVM